MGHVSNKPDQQRHFMPLSTPVRNISYLMKYLFGGGRFLGLNENCFDYDIKLSHANFLY